MAERKQKMNTFENLTRQNNIYPAIGTNEDGETVIIERGHNENGDYVRVETAQANGWIRINYYYENGDAEEMFVG